MLFTMTTIGWDHALRQWARPASASAGAALAVHNPAQLAARGRCAPSSTPGPAASPPLHPPLTPSSGSSTGSAAGARCPGPPQTPRRAPHSHAASPAPREGGDKGGRSRHLQHAWEAPTRGLERPHSRAVSPSLAPTLPTEQPPGAAPAAPPHPAHLPLEVGRDGEVHLEQAARDGLHVCAQLQPGELVHQLVQRLAVLGRADELAQLLQVSGRGSRGGMGDGREQLGAAHEGVRWEAKQGFNPGDWVLVDRMAVGPKDRPPAHMPWWTYALVDRMAVGPKDRPPAHMPWPVQLWDRGRRMQAEQQRPAAPTWLLMS